MYGSMQQSDTMTSVQAVPYYDPLSDAVNRFNLMHDELGYEQVELNDLLKFQHELNKKDSDRRIWESLIYSPRDLSVYIRSHYGDLTVHCRTLHSRRDIAKQRDTVTCWIDS